MLETLSSCTKSCLFHVMFLLELGGAMRKKKKITSET